MQMNWVATNTPEPQTNYDDSTEEGRQNLAKRAALENYWDLKEKGKVGRGTGKGIKQILEAAQEEFMLPTDERIPERTLRDHAKKGRNYKAKMGRPVVMPQSEPAVKSKIDRRKLVFVVPPNGRPPSLDTSSLSLASSTIPLLCSTFWLLCYIP